MKEATAAADGTGQDLHDFLLGFANSRLFTPEARARFRSAAELIGPRPRYRHVARGSHYTVERQGVELQAIEPVKEGALLTIYISEDGKAWARADAEFAKRFVPAA